MDYLGFILAAYLVSAVVLLALVIWVVADSRIQARALAELERTGIGRGGARQAEQPPAES